MKGSSLIRSDVQGWRLTDLLRETGFSRNTLQHILIDLEEQKLLQRIKSGGKTTLYVSEHLGQANIAFYEEVRMQKELELADMQSYAQGSGCFMDYLTSYLGDTPGNRCGMCGNCHSQLWVSLPIEESISENAVYFLERIFLPRIEKRGSIKKPEHEAGWALSFHGNTRIGKLVRASKYEERWAVCRGISITCGGSYK